MLSIREVIDAYWSGVAHKKLSFGASKQVTKALAKLEVGLEVEHQITPSIKNGETPLDQSADLAKPKTTAAFKELADLIDL